MKTITDDHVAAVREAARMIRDGLSMAAMYPPVDPKARADLESARVPAERVCRCLDEVAVVIERGDW